MVNNIEDRLCIMNLPYGDDCYGIMVPIEDKDIFLIAAEVINRKDENAVVSMSEDKYICTFTFDGNIRRLVKEIIDLIGISYNDKTEDVLSILDGYHFLELNKSIDKLNDIINTFNLLGFNTERVNEKSFIIANSFNNHSIVEAVKFILPNAIIRDEENLLDGIDRLSLEGANLIVLDGVITELTEEFLTDPKYVVIKDGKVSTNIDHIKETTILDVVDLPIDIQSLVNIVNIFKNSKDEGDILVSLSLGGEDLECYLTEEEYRFMLEEAKYMRRDILTIAF